jgi:hypothetical protein
MRQTMIAAVGAATMLFALPAAAQNTAQPRPCPVGPLGNNQIAYKASGSAVYGSDGLMCFTTKTDAPDNATTPRRGPQKHKVPKRRQR